jgi:hypothetical protein
VLAAGLAGCIFDDDPTETNANPAGAKDTDEPENVTEALDNTTFYTFEGQTPEEAL